MLSYTPGAAVGREATERIGVERAFSPGSLNRPGPIGKPQRATNCRTPGGDARARDAPTGSTCDLLTVMRAVREHRFAGRQQCRCASGGKKGGTNSERGEATGPSCPAWPSVAMRQLAAVGAVLRSAQPAASRFDHVLGDGSELALPKRRESGHLRKPFAFLTRRASPDHDPTRIAAVKLGYLGEWWTYDAEIDALACAAGCFE